MTFYEILDLLDWYERASPADAAFVAEVKPKICRIIEHLEQGTLHVFKPEAIDAEKIQQYYVTYKKLIEDAFLNFDAASYAKKSAPHYSFYSRIRALFYPEPFYKFDKDDLIYRINHELYDQFCYLDMLITDWHNMLEYDSFIYKKYENSLLFIMSQHLMPDNDDGYCFGLTMGYADDRRKQRSEKSMFPYSKQIVQHQMFQRIPEYLTRVYDHQRLTVMRYLPNISKQADFLTRQAIKHPNQDLLVRTRYKHYGHACYLSYENQKWHYFDSNVGAFEFNSADEFKAFYTDYYSQYSEKPHSVQLSKIINHKPEKTLQGTLRGLVSGSKYLRTYETKPKRILFYILAGTAGLSVCINLPILVVSLTGLNIFGLSLMPALLVVAIPALILLAITAISAVAGYYLHKSAVKNNFRGIFAPIYLLDYKCRELVQTLKSKFSNMFHRNETSEETEAITTQDAPESVQKIFQALYGVSSWQAAKVVATEAAGTRSMKFFSENSDEEKGNKVKMTLT